MRGVEWLARQRYLEGYGLGEQLDDKDAEYLEDRDFAWDAMGPYGVASKLRQKGWAGYPEIRRKVLNASDTPTSHPRARARAEFLKGKHPDDVLMIDWITQKAA